MNKRNSSFACIQRTDGSIRAAFNLDRAGVWLDKTRQHVHQRTLAGAILTDQRMDFAFLQTKVYAIERHRWAEALTDIGKRKNCHSLGRFSLAQAFTPGERKFD